MEERRDTCSEIEQRREVENCLYFFDQDDCKNSKLILIKILKFFRFFQNSKIFDSFKIHKILDFTDIKNLQNFDKIYFNTLSQIKLLK